MLTKTQLDQYHEDGYVIPGYRLPDGHVEEIREAHDRLLAKHPEFLNYCPNVLAFDLSFLNHARIPEVLDMVEQILGPDFALWNSSFFAKPAVNGQATPWHQDGEYWPIRPLATCTVWIAVDDATRENGCLRFIRGSHRDKRLLSHHTNSSPDLTLNQELEGSEYDESEAVDLVLEAGPDLAPRRVSRPRLGGEPVTPPSPRHDPSLHADDVGVRPGDCRPAPSRQGDHGPHPSHPVSDAGRRSVRQERLPPALVRLNPSGWRLHDCDRKG